MFSVYKLTGANTDAVYYGYVDITAHGNAEFAARQNLTAGYNRQDAEDRSRGDYKLVTENGNDLGSIQFVEIAYVEHQYQAHAIRNIKRAEDQLSITGPTALPCVIHHDALNSELGQQMRQACKEFTERIKADRTKTKRIEQLLAMPNAWEAINQADGLSLIEIRELQAHYGAREFKLDAFAMSPIDFCTKYGVILEGCR